MGAAVMPSELVVPRESLGADAAVDKNLADEGLFAVHCPMAGETRFPEGGIFAALNLALERAIFGFGVILTMMTA